MELGEPSERRDLGPGNPNLVRVAGDPELDRPADVVVDGLGRFQVADVDIPKQDAPLVLDIKATDIDTAGVRLDDDRQAVEG